MNWKFQVESIELSPGLNRLQPTQIVRLCESLVTYKQFQTSETEFDWVIRVASRRFPLQRASFCKVYFRSND